MFDPIFYLLIAVVALTLFFGTVPLVIAIKLGDRPRVERILDLYTEVFAAGANAVIAALKLFRRRDEPPHDKKLPPPGAG